MDSHDSASQAPRKPTIKNRIVYVAFDYMQ